MSLSLCITSYDGDYYMIDGLLKRLESQTEPPDEVLVFCSGVKRENESKTLKINNKDAPVKFFFCAERKMQSFARNFCAKEAAGEYVMFFDVDDIPHPQKVEITKSIIKQKRPTFILHSYQQHNEFNSVGVERLDNFIYQTLIKDPNSTNVLCFGNERLPIHHSHITVKKECFDNIRFNESQSFYRSEDGKFCQDLLDGGFKGLFINLPLIQYT